MESNMQIQFVTQLRLSLALSVVENRVPFGAQATIGMFVSFPSKKILAWFHAVDSDKGRMRLSKRILAGSKMSDFSKMVWSNHRNSIKAPQILAVADAFMDVFYDYPVKVYRSQAIVRDIPKPFFNSLMMSAVDRYNRQL